MQPVPSPIASLSQCLSRCRLVLAAMEPIAACKKTTAVTVRERRKSFKNSLFVIVYPSQRENLQL